MILSKSAILKSLENGDISIDPFDPEQLKPASYTFKLGGKLRLNKSSGEIALGQKQEYEIIDLTANGYLLQPHSFILGETFEHLKLSDGIACNLSTRGSVGQIGLDCLQTDYFVEPGTDGKLFLGISNSSGQPILLLPGAAIVKGVFMKAAA